MSSVVEEIKVHCDELALLSINDKSRSGYGKVWNDFKAVVGSDRNWDFEGPNEEDVLHFIRWLRLEKGYASSSLWTIYSMLNGVVKSKYGVNLKKYVRVTSLLKTFDTDVKKKAMTFAKEEFDQFLVLPKCGTPYWHVRKVIAIVTYFGGLRRIEAESLLLENFTSSSEGILVTHSHAKQRSDRRFTKFLIPRTVEDLKYADICEEYLNVIHFTLGKSVGRVWYMGHQDIFAIKPLSCIIMYNICKYIKNW